MLTELAADSVMAIVIVSMTHLNSDLVIDKQSYSCIKESQVLVQFEVLLTLL